MIFFQCVALICSLAAVSAFPYPYPMPQGALAIPRPGPDGAYAKDHYFQYTNVPAEEVFAWGYRRGNDPVEYLSQVKLNPLGHLLQRVELF